MIPNGWAILDRLLGIDPLAPLPEDLVAGVCDDLVEFNYNLRSQVIGYLKQSGENGAASELGGQLQASDELLFSRYFGWQAYSFQIPSTPPTRRDGKRAALVFHTLECLQAELIEHLRSVPARRVMNAEKSPNPDLEFPFAVSAGVIIG
ncbi:MAG: hypothetical protein R6V85_02010 [Polyangia bacterium]